MPLSQSEFQRLVNDHAEALFRVAFRLVGDRHEAEDMVQETYRSAWKSREKYLAGRGDRAWLVSILRRRIVDRWRQHQTPLAIASEHTLGGLAGKAEPAAPDYSDEMQAALDRLPRELRETLLLVVVGELTHQEVANLLEVPLGTVLSRVSRARTRLREFLLAAAKT